MTRAWWGIRTKTALGVGVLLVSSLLILGLAAYFESRELAIREVLKTIDGQLRLDGSEILRIAQDSKADLMVVRDTPPVQGIIRARDNGGIDPLLGDREEYWIARMEQIFEAYVQNRPRYVRMRYIDEKGNEIVRVDRSGDVVRVVPHGELRNVRDEPYFPTAIGSGYGKITYSDITLLRDAAAIIVPHIPVFRLATPVSDAQGRPRGIIIINVFAGYMFGTLRRDAGGLTKYLVNQDGYFLVHPDRSKEFGFEFGETATLGRLLPRIAADVESKASGVLYDARDGRIVGFRRIFFDPSVADRYWLLIYQIPERVALADLDTVGERIALSGLAVVAIWLTAITWFVSRRIVSPIVRLARAADTMRLGDLSERVDESAVKDELQVLYRSFNAFAATQQSAVARLKEEIAEKEHAQVALGRSEELFRGRLENMLEGCQIVDRGYRYHFINDAAAAQGRRPKAELLGRTMMEAYPGIENTELFSAIRACMEEGRASHFQNEFVNPDGGSGWFELSIQPAPEGVFILSADISGRKRTEEERLAREAAEIANRTKSDFLANMSHELRTPLNSIIGFTEVLQDSLYGGLNGKQREYLGYINASGRHLLELINDILDLSKVESGKTEVILSCFSLRALLDLSLVMLRERAMKQAIALACRVAPEADIVIVSDEHKLKQVVFNLLSNAVKFTPDGGQVRVDAHRSDGVEGFIEISVSDTGIGIEEKDMGRLFKEFSQLDSPLQKRYEGTGLGLALSKKLIEMLGGTISVKSVAGKGSVFSIAIPLEPPGAGARDASIEAAVG